MTMSTISVKAIDVAERMTRPIESQHGTSRGHDDVASGHPLPTDHSVNPLPGQVPAGPLCLDRLHVLVKLGHPQATVGHDHLTRLEALGDDPIAPHDPDRRPVLGMPDR